jgi:hypothetical protein
LDLIIGNLIRHYYFKQIAGEGYRTTYAIDSVEADIIVFGSSTASHHYVPEVFEDSLKMTFYNTGRDGNFFLYGFSIFMAITKRYTPKIVLFDINQNDLNNSIHNNDRLSSLYPYYRNHPEIRSIVNMKSHFERYKQISSIYPFNSSLITIWFGNLNRNKQLKSDRKGYIPLTNIITDTLLKNYEIYPNNLDPYKLNAIKYILNYCEKNKIQVYFIQSPIFANVNKIDSSPSLENFFVKNNSTFWDFTNNTCFLTFPKYFQDQIHLNYKGAIYFSQIVVNLIIKKDSINCCNRTIK